jgi:hypothetical protein
MKGNVYSCVQVKLSITPLASLLGILNCAAHSVNYAPAQCRNLQAFTQNIQSQLRVTSQLGFLFFAKSQKRPILVDVEGIYFGRKLTASPPSIFICSDASISGWEAVSDNVRTGGPWTTTDSGRHINELELIAAFNAIKCFATSASFTSIEISIDNTSAVSYINKQGGLKSGALCETALEIYSWCEARSTYLHPIYLPGSSNLVADAETRKPLAAGDSKQSTSAFQKKHQTWKTEVDLFASAWNAQLQDLSTVFLSRTHG